MRDSRKFFNKILTNFLKEYGFEKKRNSVWALEKAEFLLTIEPQRSQWSDSYFINIGIQFENLNERLPKTYRGDLQYRLIKIEDEKTKEDFILETEISLIQELIKEQVIKPFVSLDTKEDIKRIVVANPERYIITVKGKEALDIDR